MDKKIRICFVIGTLDVGGTEKQLLLLCRYIDKKRFQPFVISLRGGRIKEEFQQHGIAVKVIGKKFRIDPVCFLRLIIVLKRIKPDILQTFLFTANTWGRIAGILIRVPFIVASERSTDPWKKKYHIFVDRILAFFTDKIVCNSMAVRGHYQKKFKIASRKFVLIRNGVDFARFRQKQFNKVKTEEKIVFTASRLSPEKGIQFLIGAARVVSNRMKEVRFLIAGEGPYRKDLEEMTSSCGLKEKVVFLGYHKDV